MKVKCVWEHNGNDTMLYSSDFLGAYTRGKTLDVALSKMNNEIKSFAAWSGRKVAFDQIDFEVTEEKNSDLQISDADSDVIFKCETRPLTAEEYLYLKNLALKSAQDFLTLYNSVPDKDKSCLIARKTFYGQIPRTAREMYEHTKSVNEYYFCEIGVEADCDGDILSCRKRGFEELEKISGFLADTVVEGSYGEEWSVKKVLRRFIWHDRIHAKAMYRMAVKTFGANAVPNVFGFCD